MRIGIVGYSRSNFDHEQARVLLTEAMQSIPGINNLYERLDDFWIVSGWTDMGIPGIAYRVAQQYDIKTMGIGCDKAYDLKCFPVDRFHVIGSQWGDESPTFLAAIDVLIRIGGGLQSLKEVRQAKNMGIPVIEYELALFAEPAEVQVT